MRKFILLFTISVLLIFITACDCRVLKQSKPKNDTNSLKNPEAVVKAFCDLDAAGKRLSGPMTEEEHSYVTWPDEPGWDSVVVISGYRITNLKETSDATEVTVEYQALGKCCYSYVKLKKDEKVVYKVIKTERGWKIQSPDFMQPHVLQEQLLNYIKEGLAEEKDKEQILKYQDWIQKINDMTKP